MEFTTLNNKVEMPALGLGVFQTPPEETRAAVEAALARDYRHIDTAAAYGNERQVGEAVNDSGLDRSEVFLETKIWISDYGDDQTLHGFEKSARKLGVDQIDLLMLRWHLQQERSVIPKSTRPARIAENIDVFDFELTAEELAAIDGLDAGRRGGPEPSAITLETFGRPIPED